MGFDRKIAGKTFQEISDSGESVLVEHAMRLIKQSSGGKIRGIRHEVSGALVDHVRIPPKQQFHDFLFTYFTGLTDDDGNHEVECLVFLPGETQKKIETGRFYEYALYRFSIWVNLSRNT